MRICIDYINNKIKCQQKQLFFVYKIWVKGTFLSPKILMQDASYSLVVWNRPSQFAFERITILPKVHPTIIISCTQTRHLQFHFLCCFWFILGIKAFHNLWVLELHRRAYKREISLAYFLKSHPLCCPFHVDYFFINSDLKR